MKMILFKYTLVYDLTVIFRTTAVDDTLTRVDLDSFEQLSNSSIGMLISSRLSHEALKVALH